MNVIEAELRKLYLRHIDPEKQAELNLWITEIEPILQARNLKLQVGKPYRRDYAWKQVLRVVPAGGRRQRLFSVEMRVRQLVTNWLSWTQNKKGETK